MVNHPSGGLPYWATGVFNHILDRSASRNHFRVKVVEKHPILACWRICDPSRCSSLLDQYVAWHVTAVQAVWRYHRFARLTPPASSFLLSARRSSGILIELWPRNLRKRHHQSRCCGQPWLRHWPHAGAHQRVCWQQWREWMSPRRVVQEGQGGSSHCRSLIACPVKASNNSWRIASFS